MKVLLEGPYCGASGMRMSRFDNILMLAGGPGGGFSLAMVDEALRLSSSRVCQDGDGQRSIQRRLSLHLVYTTRDPGIAEWYIGEIHARLSRRKTSGVDAENAWDINISVHVTSQHDSTVSDCSLSEFGSDEKGNGHHKSPPTEVTTITPFSQNVLRNSRPQVSKIVEQTVLAASAHPLYNRRQLLGVLVCGPASMLHDTRNAVAYAQRRVLGGEIEEVYLHSEPFAC